MPPREGKIVINSLPFSLAERVRPLLGYRLPPLGLTVFQAFFSAAPDKAVVKLLPDVHAELNFRDPIDRAIYWKGPSYEHPTVPILSEWIERGACEFHDIGANFGYFSLLFASYYPDLTVVAWEPNPHLANRLSDCSSQNDLAIEVRAEALGSDRTTGDLVVADDDSGPSYLRDEDVSEELQHGIDTRRLPVTVTNLDSFLESGPERGEGDLVLKIDIEGYELEALKGMSQALSDKLVRGLAVEMREDTQARSGIPLRDIRDFLSRFGYRQLRAREPRFGRTTTYNEFYAPR